MYCDSFIHSWCSFINNTNENDACCADLDWFRSFQVCLYVLSSFRLSIAFRLDINLAAIIWRVNRLLCLFYHFGYGWFANQQKEHSWARLYQPDMALYFLLFNRQITNINKYYTWQMQCSCCIWTEINTLKIARVWKWSTTKETNS